MLLACSRRAWCSMWSAGGEMTGGRRGVGACACVRGRMSGWPCVWMCVVWIASAPSFGNVRVGGFGGSSSRQPAAAAAAHDDSRAHGAAHNPTRRRFRSTDCEAALGRADGAAPNQSIDRNRRKRPKEERSRRASSCGRHLNLRRRHRRQQLLWARRRRLEGLRTA